MEVDRAVVAVLRKIIRAIIRAYGKCPYCCTKSATKQKGVIMKRFVILGVLLASIPASAASLPCSIHPKKGTPAADLSALAKISLAEAQQTALTRIKAPPTSTVGEGELEVERGCLVYSFDIRVPGKSGIEEVIVDAGNGEVLSRKPESARREAAEQAKDKAAKGKSQ
jgi:hypothetical protein